MSLIIKKGDSKEDMDLILSQLIEKAKKGKGINAMKYCGVITLKENPENIQFRLRDEWE